ncbi:DEAD-box ATP-dependent RNA helicase 50 [Olea europaea subsp. europaea]|uniref:DEAD-box ATP-dependent RNA helicase 50 n=1 Tax=Olea europaea subsp. europaea TaxID=158383 RepID=A0A8S0UZY5_OLEEU|nr:DEAD-box ATP-dependent RNA helicase 50 [Olea europaea subsp. europaea]
MAGMLEILSLSNASVSLLSGGRRITSSEFQGLQLSPNSFQSPSLSSKSSCLRARIVCDAAQQISLDEGQNRGESRSFKRLKAQRVRYLVRESHKKKKQDSNLEHDEQKAKITPQDFPTVSHDEPNSLDEQVVSCVKKDASKKIHSRVRSARQNVLSIASAASSKGWGNVEPSDSYGYKVDDISKKLKKLNIKSDFFSRKSFEELGCSGYIIESLGNQNYIRPSHIQAMAFTPVIGGKSCIIADQSGSGKTLSYLVPLVQRLRQDELQGLGKPVSQCPRVVILVPTAELASQVLSNCRSLSKVGAPFRSMVATGGFRQRTQLENLKQELDVLIATPGRFMFLVKEGFLQLTNLKCAVLDEVDILFNDEDFELALQSLVNSAPVTMQYLFVTATLPVEIYNKLVETFPDCEVIMGPGMHRTSPGLEEILIDCSGDENSEKTPDTAFLNKKNALLRLVEESPVTKTIVFCNKIETCRKVENALKRFDRKGICTRVLPFHSALEQESRLTNMREFHSLPANSISMFLVCTDRASRGIDFAGVDHVVLFDFPRDPSEYVRRVGRTARGAGGKGKAFIFVVGKQVSLARRIIERNRKGHPLHDVPSTYEMMS